MINLKVLLDMDSVITDTPRGFIKRWGQMFPKIPCVPYEKMFSFDLEKLYSREHKNKVLQVWNSQGLFYGLNPMPGALESIEEIKRKVRDIAICTSYPIGNKSAAQDKYEWVRCNLGEDWTRRLIITRDKTRINGDLLIDDKPKIFGAQTPSWEHVLYTHPWNVKVKNLRRLTWDNWREVLIELK